MTAHRDPDRLIHEFLLDGAEELHDQVYDAVRADIEHRRQRAVIGPWRMPHIMNKLVPIGLGAAAVVGVLVLGTQLLGPAAPDETGEAPAATPMASPSPTPLGDIVRYQLDGGPATTEVDVVADGGSVSGTAVTTFVGGTHTVRLECAARDGDTWALGGTTEQTTVSGERAGDWSAVVVKDGSPQQIGIWISDPKSEGSDCDGWLASISLAEIGLENFQPVESGALVPPLGDIVRYQLDGGPATTEVDVVADGGSVSGTAVTTFVGGTHTVRLECAARDGDTWALGGTTEQTTVSGERAGDWSAVVVKDGSPQQIGIWISDPKSEGSDCDGWLASISLAEIGLENFQPVESGALVPPPDLAP